MDKNHRSLNTNDVGSSQVAQTVKNLPANAGDIRDTGSIPGSGRAPGERRKWQPTPVFFSAKFHEQRRNTNRKA